MKVKFIIIMLVAIGLAACSSPKKDAEKVCKCLESVIELSKDEANEEAMMAKYAECEKMANEFDAKYKEDPAKYEEFHSSGQACADKLEEPM